MTIAYPLRQLGFGKRLPVYVQSEATECGLCCLAMVADFHGYRTDLASLRLRFAISRKGATLHGLIGIAHALKLETRALKLDMPNLRDLQLPCILHWDMNHFVVLRSLSARHAVIHDPAVGERRLPMSEVARHFTGVALEVAPANDFAPAEQRLQFTVRGLMGRVTGLKRGLGQILLLALALELTAIAAPFYMQWLVDHALVSADLELISVLALGFGLLVLVQTAIGAVRAWFVVALSTRFNFQWLGNVFGHLVKLPLEYFERRHIGHILSCFGSVATIQKTLTTGFVEALVDGVMVVGTLVMMLTYSPQLASVALLAVLLYAMARWAAFHALRNATAEQIVHAAKQQTHFIETARGIQSVRLFGRGEQRRAGWLNLVADQFNADLRIQGVHVSHESARTLLFGVERVVVLWLGARFVLDQSFTIGMLFAFMAYKEQFATRVAALIDKSVDILMLRLHGARVADIVMTASEPTLPADDGSMDLSHLHPSIELRKVAFRYSPTEPYVFRDLDLKIDAGEFVAITGSSGCGKTTLVKVMLGLLAPTEGEVLLGGIPVLRLGLENYRALIGTVMQEDQIFSGSVADNICFFDPSPDLDRIADTARQAAVESEILGMPMGYNTLMGDMGVGVSGGQKQRILLARALYRGPRILVLDEATSELDVHNERCVNAAISAMNLTRIIVAHRPETIEMARRVVTIAEGKVSSDRAASA